MKKVNYYEEYETENESVPTYEPEIGCGFCRDRRTNKDIELYYIDRANNMRPCIYCPSCGRKLG